MSDSIRAITFLCTMGFCLNAVVMADVEFPKDSENPILESLSGRWNIDGARMKELGYLDQGDNGTQGFALKVDNTIAGKWTPQRIRTINTDLADQIGENTWIAVGKLTAEAKNRKDNQVGQFILTERRGQTCVVMLFKGFRPLAFRVSLIRGKTNVRDLMYLEVMNGGEESPVLVLQRHLRPEKKQDKKLVAAL